MTVKRFKRVPDFDLWEIVEAVIDDPDASHGDGQRARLALRELGRREGDGEWCGTWAGYLRHTDADDDPCDPCDMARMLRQRIADRRRARDRLRKRSLSSSRRAIQLANRQALAEAWRRHNGSQ